MKNKYDAVVLDVNMPVMGGLELLRELQTRKIPVRVMMASTDTRDGAKVTMDALELGAIDFVHKSGNIKNNRTEEFQKTFWRRCMRFPPAESRPSGEALIWRASKPQRSLYLW